MVRQSDSPTMQSLLLSPGVKDSKVVSFPSKDDDDKDKESPIRSVITGKWSQRSAFQVLDLEKVMQLMGSWRRGLGDVRPFYAVKCNPDPALLGALAELGAGFDCASRAEMEAVLALGVQPGRIVYANPCKAEAHLEFAAAAGVNLTTYDSEHEVGKIKRCHPSCALLIRLKGPDPAGGEVKIDLGTKYGARADEVSPLLLAARGAGLHVAGVSFHVGTGATGMDVYRGAVASARAAFDAAVALGLPPMRVLDIGGGFTAGAKFQEAAAVVDDALKRHFGDLLPRVEVIAEPGRFFAETAFTFAARVIGKRTRGEVREYWIDDGVHGSFSCTNVDHYAPRPKPLALAPTTQAGSSRKTYTSTVFGPTCDPRDLVVAGYQLPEMSAGDWLVFENMGAYATAAGSNFNGLYRNTT